MLKQLKIGDAALTIQSVYPYIYNYGQGREALRIEIARADHGYADIEAALEAPAGDIAYYEDDLLVNLYKDYTRDFRCSYQNGSYSVELTRVSELERKVEQLEAQLAALTAQ